MTIPVEPDETRSPNRLARETSPYLLQHAYNPVDWFPWGEEAQEKARALNRPIFLSVGYSSCHWCHVMERESFEDVAIASLMNEHFINIKVDREERPDVDAIYMTAVQMLTGSGGWPMSVFLTPELKPFWGGTYFPPRGLPERPGFPEILTELARVFRTEPERIAEAAEQLTGHLIEGESFAPAPDLPGIEAIEHAVAYSKRSFDPAHGGFGPAPKFPRPVEIGLLLRHHARSEDPEALAAAEKTLQAMAYGGLYDQVGGGFHRYSTDARWLVPHFEKMLYDNALLARSYLEAYQLTERPFYREVVVDLLDYVLREMRSPEGGFYSATDADSEGEEGKFFVWTPAEVTAVVGAERSALVCRYYNITKAGNFEGGTSIAHVTCPLEEVAEALSVDPIEAREALQQARRELYEAREARVKPFRDEKVITAWNALMVSAFARAYQVLGDERYRCAGEQAAEFLEQHLVREGRLQRTFKDGQARNDGFLDDYAYLLEAELDLFEATFVPAHLDRADALARHLLEHFWDDADGGFFFTASYHETMICRKKEYLDNATPAGSGVAALALLRLGRIVDNPDYRARVEAIFRAARPLLDKAPTAFGYTLTALHQFLEPPIEIAVLGDRSDPATQALLDTAHAGFRPGKLVVGCSSGASQELAKRVPLLRDKEAIDGRPTAYVCRDFSCQPPVVEPRDLARQLGSVEGI